MVEEGLSEEGKKQLTATILMNDQFTEFINLSICKNTCVGMWVFLNYL